MHRFWGGHRGGNRHTVNKDLDGTDQPGFDAQSGTENGFKHIGGGSFPVCSGHREPLQLRVVV